MRNLSITGMIGGLLFTILSEIRYFVIWPDPDKAFAYGVIGLLIILVSYLFERDEMILAKINHNAIVLDQVEQYLQDKKWIS